MSTTEVPVPSQVEQKRRAWPDLSSYGLYFGVLEMPNGENRLVMVDTDAGWATLARRMGFQQTRWLGVWVRKDLQFKIPDYKTLFPRGKVLQLTDDEIRQQIRVKLLERQSMRLSQMKASQQAPKGQRLSWRGDRPAAGAAPSKSLTPPQPIAPQGVPTQAKERKGMQPLRPVRKALPPAVRIQPTDEDLAPSEEVVIDAPAIQPVDAQPEPERTVTADVAIRQTVFLGVNHLGHRVYEAGDGLRFTRSQEDVRDSEAEPNGGPAFLRASSEGDLHLCALGMVTQMQEGSTLHSEDFARYVGAIFGEASIDDKEVVNRFQRVVDDAMLEIAARQGGTDVNAYELALKLHENRPRYWRKSGTLPTPLPIAVAMQSIVIEHVSANNQPPARIIDITQSAKAHSWALPDATAVLAGDIPEHDVAVGGIFSDALLPAQASSAQATFGIRVNRADHLSILNALHRRSDSGISALLIAGDRRPGHIAPEMRRVLQHVGSRYEIRGLVDIDANMIEPGNQVSSRLLVVGPKRKEIDLSYSVPAQLPVMYDYDKLWGFVESIKAGEAEELTFGEDLREENRWQAPYIPTSQVTEPKAMAPRNLLGPIRRALARIVEAEGMGIDEYVASKLEWTVEQMEENEYLDSEQVDAVALMIFAAENGTGFVEADAAGMGKGRPLAAMMRYYRLRGKTVVFLTENTALFRDIYRDIIDIGSLDLFMKPLIINNNVTLKSYDGTVIAQSPDRDTLRRILLQDSVPEEYSNVLATYSQFNRTLNYISPGGAKILAAIDQMAAGEKSRHEVLADVGSWVGIRIEHAGGALDNEAALENLRNAAAKEPATSDMLPQIKHQIRLRELHELDFIKELDGLVPKELMALKQHWINGYAVKGSLFVIDESHNASGPDSTTNQNLSVAVRNAECVLYSSATFAKDTQNFGIYHRVFPSGVDIGAIGSALVRGGEPLQEILSVGLAEDGRMIRREHDNSNVEYRTIFDQQRVQRNEQWADSLANVLSAMSVLSGEISRDAVKLNNVHLAQVEAAVAAAEAAGKTTHQIPSIGVQYTNFSSRFHNITRTFMLAIKADLAAELAINAVSQGRKPILAVESTMESVIQDMLRDDMLPDAREVVDADQDVIDVEAKEIIGTADGEEAAQATSSSKAGTAIKRSSVIATGRRLGFKDILRKYADNMFFAWETKVKGKTVVSRKKLDLRKPELEAAIAEIYALIDQMPDVPLSPIDAVREQIEKRGYSFEELSGRKSRLETAADGTHNIVRFKKGDRTEIVDRFNSGQTQVLLATKAGSTGISVHAGSKFIDQSQRELIEWQAISNVVGRQQMHGRHNRKDQVTSPIVTMTSSMLPGETRLAMMQNNALRKISAMTSGNADNAGIDMTVPDLLNKVGNEICYRWIENNPHTVQMMGIKMPEGGESEAARMYGTRWVDALTGRIMMLPVDEQRRVYAELDVEFSALIEQYELEGRNPLKAAQFDIKATKVRSKEFDVSGDIGGSVFNEPVIATEIAYSGTVPALDPAVMEAEAKEGREEIFNNWGGAGAWIKNLHAAIDKQCADMLPSLLNSDFSTVEAALVSEQPNAIKNYSNKADQIKDIITSVIPGSFVRVSSNMHDRAPYFVTAVDIPSNPAKLCSPSEYRVHMYSSASRAKTSMTLSSLINIGNRFSVDLTYGGDHYDKYKTSSFWSFDSEHEWKSSRVILEGNLFKAAILADKASSGQCVTFTNENGIWQHAIMMPAKVKFENINLPVHISSPESLAAYLRDADFANVFDKENREQRCFEINKDTKGRLAIYLFKGADKSGWIIKSESISATFSEDPSGTRTIRKVVIDPSKIEAFAEAFFAASSSRRISLQAPADDRKWFNEFNKAAAEKKASALEEASKLAAADLNGGNLAADLASLGL